MLHRIGKAHLTTMMMMTIALAVGRDVHQLGPISFLGKSADQSAGELFAVVEQSFKGDGARNRAVVEESGDFSLGGQAHFIGSCRINAISTDIFPRTAAKAANSRCLPRRQNGELDAICGENIESIQIDRRLSKPTAPRRASKPMFETPNS